jgi:hypothetical protein
MVGSFPLWEWDRTARQEPRPPEESVVRLGRSLALPRGIAVTFCRTTPVGFRQRRVMGCLYNWCFSCRSSLNCRTPHTSVFVERFFASHQLSRAGRMRAAVFFDRGFAVDGSVVGTPL